MTVVVVVVVVGGVGVGRRESFGIRKCLDRSSNLGGDRLVPRSVYCQEYRVVELVQQANES